MVAPPMTTESPTTPTAPRLAQLYIETVAPKTAEKFGLRNRHQWPRLSKVVVNCGIG